MDGFMYLESLNGVNDINEVEMFKGCTSLKSVLLGKHFARINGANMFDGYSSDPKFRHYRDEGRLIRAVRPKQW